MDQSGRARWGRPGSDAAALTARAVRAAAALRARSRGLLRGELLALALCALVVCAFYCWTASTTSSEYISANYYSQLTDGFLDGEAYLPSDPPPELLALPDPYDPAQNGPYMTTDVSLYDGHYYLYFGPTPVLLVHLPLRLIGIDAHAALSVTLLFCVGYLFALALMRFLVERYRPQTSIATRVVLGLILGLANVAPFLLRRPGVWEEAIAGGYCCLLAGLYLSLTAVLRERPSLGRLAGGSLALGLAVGARPSLLVALPVWVWAWSVALRASGSRRAALRVLSAALAPLALCLLLLAIYNAIRFDSPFEFGQKYQLGAGVNSPLADRFDLSRVAPNFFSYLLAPPHPSLIFPFVHLDPAWTGVVPARFIAEPVAGLLATTPVAVLAFAAPVILLVRRAGREAMTLASCLLLAALLTLLVPAVSLNGSTERYKVDFATMLLLASLLVWLRVEDATAGRALLRHAGRIVAGAAGTLAVVVGLALSITGYWDGLRTERPRTYERLKGAFDFVPILASKIQGEPVVLEIQPSPGTPTGESVVQFAAPGAGTAVIRVTPVAGSLPQGSLVPTDVREPDGHVTRIRMTIGDPALATVRFDGAGVADVRFYWGVARMVTTAAPTDSVAAGVGLDDKRVVKWSPR